MERSFGYHTLGRRALLMASTFGLALSMAACSSGCSSSTPSPPVDGTAQTTGAAPSAQAGALPLLAQNGVKQTFTFDEGPHDLLDYANEKVRVSASCAKPDGSLDCDAIRLLRRGQQVQLSPDELGAGLPPGAVVCRKLGIANTVGRGPNGNEDGFCKLPDGSLVSHGSVDTHVLKP